MSPSLINLQEHHPDGATLPQGTEVASYATYVEAQAGVDYLAEHDFDLRTVSIVGVDVYVVEHITGRLNSTRVAFSGATSGLMWGAFFGLVMSFMNQSVAAPTWLMIGATGGVLTGMVLALVAYILRQGKRDFVSHSHVVAGRYAIVVASEPRVAFDLLQKTPGNQRRPVRPAPRPTREVSDGPTEYGSRPDEKPRFGVRLSDSSEAPTPAAPAPEVSASVVPTADSAATAPETESTEATQG